MASSDLPGLYTIVNLNGVSFVDLFENTPGAGVRINGYPKLNQDNQKWYLADVGNDEYVIISRSSGAYIQATKINTPLVSAVGYPDAPHVRWKISFPEPDDHQIVRFHSLGVPDTVLDLSNFSSEPNTPLQVYKENYTPAQKWILKRVT